MQFSAAEYKHVENLVKDLKRGPIGTTEWWNRFRFVRDRVKNDSVIGLITIQEYLYLTGIIEKIEQRVKEVTKKRKEEQKRKASEVATNM